MRLGFCMGTQHQVMQTNTFLTTDSKTFFHSYFGDLYEMQVTSIHKRASNLFFVINWHQVALSGINDIK